MSILVDEQSTLIIQGITGRESVTMTRELLDYGAKVVGGVTPGRKGRDVHGVPVEDTVRALTERMHVDGSIVAVPPAFAIDAVLEAMTVDKKKAEGAIRWVLLNAIGHAVTRSDVPPDLVQDALGRLGR